MARVCSVRRSRHEVATTSTSTIAAFVFVTAAQLEQVGVQRCAHFVEQSRSCNTETSPEAAASSTVAAAAVSTTAAAATSSAAASSSSAASTASRMAPLLAPALASLRRIGVCHTP